MNKQAATGWGEIKKPEPELKYPEWMSLDYAPRKRIKRRQHIKNRIMTGAWALTTIGMGIALIVWG